jgi:hypothetical protein
VDLTEKYKRLLAAAETLKRLGYKDDGEAWLRDFADVYPMADFMREFGKEKLALARGGHDVVYTQGLERYTADDLLQISKEYADARAVVIKRDCMNTTLQAVDGSEEDMIRDQERIDALHGKTVALLVLGDPDDQLMEGVPPTMENLEVEWIEPSPELEKALEDNALANLRRMKSGTKQRSEPIK